jgi:hypothetical protein
MVPLARPPESAKDYCANLWASLVCTTTLRRGLGLIECSMSGQPVHRSPPPRRCLPTSSLYPMVHDPNLLQIFLKISGSWSGRPKAASQRYFCETRAVEVSSSGSTFLLRFTGKTQGAKRGAGRATGFRTATHYCNASSLSPGSRPLAGGESNGLCCTFLSSAWPDRRFPGRREYPVCSHLQRRVAAGVCKPTVSAKPP